VARYLEAQRRGTPEVGVADSHGPQSCHVTMATPPTAARLRSRHVDPRRRHGRVVTP
jgi:hypothetical protein